MAQIASEQARAAVITGGGRGIGRAIALRLARSGPIIVVGRTHCDLESVCNDCKEAGGVAIPIAGDIVDPQTANLVISTAKSNGWFIEHLVCNAGIGKSGPTAEFDPMQWRRIFDVNVHGCFNFVQACLPEMLSRNRGQITIISSMAGVVGVAYDAAYSASKHALVGLARSLALEVGKRGISVSALCPSFVESEMTSRTIRSVMRRHNLSESDARKRVASHCPTGRILEAEEIAEAVASLGAGNLAAASALAAKGGYPIEGSELENTTSELS